MSLALLFFCNVSMTAGNKIIQQYVNKGIFIPVLMQYFSWIFSVQGDFL